MASNHSDLCGVPSAMPRESISSWLSRLALSQGESLPVIARYCKIKLVPDFDLMTIKPHIRRMSLIAGIPLKTFSDAKKIFSSVHSIDALGHTYLLFANSKPKYRFCPMCLKSDKDPYFRVEWRFKAWRVCLFHYCLLEDHCANCKTPVTLPLDMFNSGFKNSGIGSLSMCANCGEFLTKVMPALTDNFSDRRLSKQDLLLITNSRALMASFYFKKFKIEGFAKQYKLGSMKQVNKAKIFPWDKFEWTADSWREALITTYSTEIDDLLQPNAENHSNGR